jgi:CRP-like cAMP-binding protein
MIASCRPRSTPKLVINGAFVVEQARTGAPDDVQGHLAAVMVEPERPCFVGEMAWLGSFARTASVRSSGRLQALRLSAPHMETILSRFPDLTRALCRQFAQRLKGANEQVIAYQSEKLMKTAIQIKSPGDIVLTGGQLAQTLYQLVEGEVLVEGCE